MFLTVFYTTLYMCHNKHKLWVIMNLFYINIVNHTSVIYEQ